MSKRKFEQPVLPFDLWQQIASFLDLVNLSHLRTTCRRFRHLQQGTVELSKLERCISNGNFSLSIVVCSDDLETYKLLEEFYDLTDNQQKQHLAHAIYHQASRCMEYIWSKIKYPLKLADLELFWPDDGEFEGIRNQNFGQQVLRMLIDHQIPWFILFDLNCPTTTKLKLLASDEKQDYLNKCIRMSHEPLMVEQLLSEGVIPETTVRIWHYDATNFHTIQAVCQRYGYQLPDYVSPIISSTVLAEKISDNCQNKVFEYCRCFIDPSLLPPIGEKIWPFLHKILNLEPTHRREIVNICINCPRHCLTEARVHLLTGQSLTDDDLSELEASFDNYEDKYLFHLFLKNGGLEYLEKVMNNVDVKDDAFSCWGIHDRTWELLVQTGPVIKLTFEQLERFVTDVYNDQYIDIYFFDLIRYFGSIKTPNLLEMLLALEVSFLWLHIAYWSGVLPSPSLIVEARQVLQQVGLPTDDHPVLLYLRYRYSNPTDELFNRWNFVST